MAPLSEIQNIARNYLRDFPKFFQVQLPAPVGRTHDTGHVNLDPASLWVAKRSSSGTITVVSSADYTLDARNGMIRLGTALASTETLLMEGYHYEWLLPDDLAFYAKIALHEHTHNTDVAPEDFSPVVLDVVGISCLVESLWGLLTEYSRDIDVMTSESIHIPASQRFRMVESLLQFWEAEYMKKAQALNIGLHRIEVFTLRRVSRSTNRLVPLIKAKELGDYGPLERLFPPVDPGVIEVEEKGDPSRQDVFIDDTDPPQGYVSGTAFT